MNVDKIRVARRRRSESDPKWGVDSRVKGLGRENILDLLEVIEDEGRFHAAAGLLTQDPVERERYRRLARADSALLASIRHGLACAARQHVSHHERTRELQRYAQLMVGSQRRRSYALLSTTNVQGGGT